MIHFVESIRGKLRDYPALAEIIALFLLVGIVYFAVKGALVLGFRSPYPIMGVKTGSMDHEDESWRINYKERGFEPSEFPFQDGLQIGDLVFVKGVDSLDDIEVGDVIAWKYSNEKYIHRVWIINENEGTVTTRGDANEGFLEKEVNMSFDRIVGKAVFSVPYLGQLSIRFRGR
ncbi:hypothetical protein AKJ50_01450 [candidate division MSBL1 archaeon SCGC-AAA382A13]|uniref:Signal peptidase I n=1 Tax=candidate division MSBL1 archaeon SCGC-AAA382A13 TaxID=1698279 RepID=A0A133VFL0_9EURY|nr:hypothetical protein AKJ50_01450 [candidate division MSBL1 archaeon SCGC-AAA382A13]